ncbi:uncharacterized protein LOC129222148 [Uloborus diversus]|uniref:uncharacterized protein LOC129222148 n=1 Tax=Uloborus diversus TaxID=327109 RepID=UPI002409969A|nr:uncharacterized protein LOC129222148 [Uloborus diversus]
MSTNRSCTWDHVCQLFRFINLNMVFILVPVFYLLFLCSQISCSEEEPYDEVAKFEEVLEERSAFVVLFTEECCACTECVEAEVLMGGMSQELENTLGIFVVRLKKPDLRPRYGIKTVPALIFIRDDKIATFDGKFEIEEVYSWLEQNRNPATVDLDDESFEHLTQAATGATTGDWLVIFHDGKCCKNRELIHLENAGIKLKNKVNVASVDITAAPETAKRFKITSCPSIIFFRHQKMYRYSLSEISASTLKRFALGFYKNSKAENVQLPQTAFDKLLDKTIEFYSDYWYSLLVILALTTVFTTTLLICAVIKPSPRKKAE